MDGMFMDMFPIALLLIGISGAKQAASGPPVGTGYLSTENTKRCRGFFALVVVLHHLSQRTEAGLLLRVFTKLGNPATAVFFFLSGYGLQKSYLEKQGSYSRGFLLRRFRSVLLPYMTVTLLYRLIHGGGRSLSGNVLAGDPTLPFSWYLISILSFYLVFWLLMRLCGERYSLMILGGCVWNLCYTAFCVKMGYGAWWYTASHLLPIGMCWAVYEERLVDIVGKTNGRWALAAGLLPAAAWVLSGSRVLPASLLAGIRAVLFVLGILLVSMKVRVGNRVLDFLGGISLEIYLTQGLFMDCLRGASLYLESDLMYSVLVLTGTVLSGAALHFCFQKGARRYGRLRAGRRGGAFPVKFL